MFHLMDRVSDGVQPMICHLENHVITTGLADMIGAAATISTVCHLHYSNGSLQIFREIIWH